MRVSWQAPSNGVAYALTALSRCWSVCTMAWQTKKKNLVSKLLEDNPLGRQVLFKKATETVMKQSGGHYPAPLAILDCIRTVRIVL